MGRVVSNLSKAGAKVIAFDIQFDSPDARSEYLGSVSDNLPSEFQQYLPGHGDILLAESIKNAQDNGTKVVMDVKNGERTNTYSSNLYCISCSRNHGCKPRDWPY